MTPNAALIGTYDYRLVALSIFISLLTASAALDLAGRALIAAGKTRLAWLSGGSIAMGIGIWAMHYVGMEALTLPVRVLYDWPTVMLSLFAAIVASGTALIMVTRPTLGLLNSIAGSVSMGSGIAVMHYIGMDAMRLPAMCLYSAGLVTLSIVLAIAISYAALQLTFALRAQDVVWGWQKLGGAVTMGLAIPTMHYVGMAAVSFQPMASMHGSVAHAVSVSRLGLVAIAMAATILLCFALLASMIDRRLASQAQLLLESQLQLQTIFDHMSEGLVVLDRKGKVVLLNQAASRVFKVSEGESFLQEVVPLFDAFSTQGVPVPPEMWPANRALEGVFESNVELVFKRRSTGEIGVREVSTLPLTDERGDYSRIILTYRDVTERRRLDEARMRLAAIVESSDDAIVGKDIHGTITSWNRGAEKVFGYSAEEMIGESIKRLLPADREHEEDEILGRILKGEAVDHLETERTRKDGRVIHVSLTISPIRDASGAVIGASKIARDITDRVKMENQLRQSQKMEAIGQLTGGIAHDFNNLLGIIIGNLELLERRLVDDEVKLRHVRSATKAATRGADLTRRLLMFSSKDELRPSNRVVQELVEGVIDLASQALGAQIKVVTHFDSSTPSIDVDADGLESALLNLMVNARDAMPGGGTLTISTKVRRIDPNYDGVGSGEIKAGQYVCISVTDTGSGMVREVADRAFEPFFTTKPSGRGTGLGLALVYGFTKQSGGLARIYSEPGSGTTVSLYLPIAQGIGSSGADETMVDQVAVQHGCKVLVVDDEVELLEIALAYLRDLGYDGVTASDAVSALAIVSRERDISVVVTDITMPGGMNGVQLAKEIGLISPDIKVIFCSGFPVDTLSDRNGPWVDGLLLHKPYQRSEFAAMIRRAIDSKMPD